MLNRLFLVLSVLPALVGILSADASAQTLLDAKDPEAIRNIASGYGSALLTTDSQGDPKISGRIDGVAYSIFFYGCEDGENCKSIQFKAGWSGVGNFTAKTASEWNLKKRFGAAYLDSDGDPGLQWDVNLFAGVTINNIDDTFDWWSIVLKEFDKHLDAL